MSSTCWIGAPTPNAKDDQSPSIPNLQHTVSKLDYHTAVAWWERSRKRLHATTYQLPEGWTQIASVAATGRVAKNKTSPSTAATKQANRIFNSKPASRDQRPYKPQSSSGGFLSSSVGAKAQEGSRKALTSAGL